MLSLSSACDSADDDDQPSLDAASQPADDAGAGAPDTGVLDGSQAHDAAASDAGARDPAPQPSDAAVSDAAASDAAASGDPLENLRKVCVDTINEHRATLKLAPLGRATRTQETCSDQGAKKDGDSNSAHSSGGDCSGLGAQNTCPAWKFGPGTGNATLEAALKRCLQQMSDEGMPPVSVKACIADKACFPKYGHWINMTSTNSRVASCGFYDMGKNTYWMNQDFGR